MKHLHLQNQFHKLPTFHRHQLWFERKRVEKNRLFNGLGLVCDHFVLENSAWGYHNFFILSQHIQHISLSNDFLDLTICNRTNLRYWYWNIYMHGRTLNCGNVLRWSDILQMTQNLFFSQTLTYEESFFLLMVWGNSMLRTLHFLETNFLKLIVHSFEFIICSNIPHKVIDYWQRKHFPFFNRCCQYSCLKLFHGHYKKKINLQFNVFTWHSFSCELTIQTKVI